MRLGVILVIRQHVGRLAAAVINADVVRRIAVNEQAGDRVAGLCGHNRRSLRKDAAVQGLFFAGHDSI